MDPDRPLTIRARLRIEHTRAGSRDRLDLVVNAVSVDALQELFDTLAMHYDTVETMAIADPRPS